MSGYEVVIEAMHDAASAAHAAGRQAAGVAVAGTLGGERKERRLEIGGA